VSNYIGLLAMAMGSKYRNGGFDGFGHGDVIHLYMDLGHYYLHIKFAKN